MPNDQYCTLSHTYHTGLYSPTLTEDNGHNSDRKDEASRSDGRTRETVSAEARVQGDNAQPEAIENLICGGLSVGV